jgi:hypothetical protein
VYWRDSGFLMETSSKNGTKKTNNFTRPRPTYTPSQIHQSDPVDKFRSLTAKQGRAGSYDGDELGADFTKYSNGYRLPARRK